MGIVRNITPGDIEERDTGTVEVLRALRADRLRGLTACEESCGQWCRQGKALGAAPRLTTQGHASPPSPSRLRLLPQLVVEGRRSRQCPDGRVDRGSLSPSVNHLLISSLCSTDAWYEEVYPLDGQKIDDQASHACLAELHRSLEQLGRLGVVHVTASADEVVLSPVARWHSDPQNIDALCCLLVCIQAPRAIVSEPAHTQYRMQVDIAPRKVVIRHPKVPEAGDTEEVVCHLHQDVRPIQSADCVRAGVYVQEGRCHSGVQNDPCQSARAYQALHCICRKILAFRPK